MNYEVAKSHRLKPLLFALGGFVLAGCAADADSDDESRMTDCDGGKLDPATNLCWQDPPGDGAVNWYVASGTHHDDHNPGGVDYCGDLVHGGHSDWRLPYIHELITLLRGCEDGIATGDLSPGACEMIPAGCADEDNCTGAINCYWCPMGDGPGADGCYWDPALGGDCRWYWSSSRHSTHYHYARIVAFTGGGVHYDGCSYTHGVRCVR